MVFSPEQRDALVMVRALLAAADRVVDRCYGAGTGEDIGEAVRLAERSFAILRDVQDGGPGPVVGAAGRPDQARPSDADRLLGGLVALLQARADGPQVGEA